MDTLKSQIACNCLSDLYGGRRLDGKKGVSTLRICMTYFYFKQIFNMCAPQLLQMVQYHLFKRLSKVRLQMG